MTPVKTRKVIVMAKKTITTITEHKSVLIKKALIVGGTIVGGIIANGMLDRLNAQRPDVLVVEVVEEDELVVTDNEKPVVDEN